MGSQKLVRSWFAILGSGMCECLVANNCCVAGNVGSVLIEITCFH